MTVWRHWVAAALLPAFMIAPTGAKADALSDAYAAILANPQDIQANFAYARAAEEAGQHQRAIATYERIILVDPDNAEALEALKRVRLIIQPVLNTRYAELGARWESNPRGVNGPADEEMLAFGRFNYTDERTLGEKRWRTALSFLGELYFESSDLNYADVSLMTGPLYQFGTGSSLHTAIGGAVAYFDEEFFYAEAQAAFTLRWLRNDAVQSARLRAGYRQYGESFVTDNGFYVDAMANLVFASVEESSAAVILSPWIRYSDIGGSIEDFLDLVDEPGSYTEVGARLGADTPVTDWLSVGAAVSVSGRFFNTLASGSTENRTDVLIAPEAFVTFPDLFSDGLDLKLAYQYQWRDSNSDGAAFVNHAISLSLVFDR